MILREIMARYLESICEKVHTRTTSKWSEIGYFKMIEKTLNAISSVHQSSILWMA